MNRLTRAVVLFFLAAVLSACGQKSAGLQEGAVAPDTTLFENGMEYLEKSQYIKARLSFQTLINTYPDSEYTPTAFLAIADSYYNEGGTENLLQAESQYKDFLIFYPTHEMADDAQLKIAAINVRLMKPHDRDPTYARKAQVELDRFLDNYPDSELAPTAREVLRDVNETLAKGIHEIGRFYFGRNAYLAAESRYKEVLEGYENFSELDVTLYELGESLERLGRVEEASVYYARLAQGYPFSEYYDEAREKLMMLEKPVPPVDEEEAARNAANLRVEDFSIFDPIRSVWRAFTGGPDIYEIARQRAEQRQARNTEGPPDLPGGSHSN